MIVVIFILLGIFGTVATLALIIGVAVLNRLGELVEAVAPKRRRLPEAIDLQPRQREETQ